MFTDYVNNSTGITESIKSNTSLSNITQLLSGDFQNDFLEKSLTPDQKAAMVSDTLISNAAMDSYNLSLMPDMPLTRSGNISNVFNEIPRSSKNQTTKSAQSNSIDTQNLEFQIEGKNLKGNSGYYLVLSEPREPASTKLLNGYLSEFQKRINSTYGIQKRRDPGMLVDLHF